MSREKTSVTKNKPTLPETGDGKPITASRHEAFGLISSGFLPPADSITKEGSPTWTFENIAVILGCDVDELTALLRGKPPRFTIEPGARH